jgi:hypothetical protein
VSDTLVWVTGITQAITAMVAVAALVVSIIALYLQRRDRLPKLEISGSLSTHLGADWGAPIRPDSSISQLLWRSDVELHPHRGGEIVQVTQKPHQRVQARVLSASGHRREAPRPDLP